MLISPRSIAGVDWEGRRVDVALSRQQVEQAPPIEADAPVSRRMEVQLADYYAYQPYWYGPGLWGGAALPFGAGLSAAAIAASSREPASEERAQGDQHLRSTREVQGYAIRARDGDIGHISDFVMDDESWAMRYLVINTGGWLSGKHVLIAPLWASAVRWEERVVELDLTREQVRSGPEYDPQRLTRDDEQRLHAHYQRPGYWDSILF